MFKSMYPLACVALGGASGALARYLVSLLPRLQPTAFPAATLLVNGVGCFLLGAVAGLAAIAISLPIGIRLFFVTGFCGAFTTMSSFVYEADQLMRSGEVIRAVAYIGATYAGSFALFFGGYAVVRVALRA